MSEDEKKTLKSYADSGDWKSAKDYLGSITAELTKRQRENRREINTEVSRKAPVVAAIANIGSAPAQAASFLPVAATGIASAVTGKDIKLDPNSDIFAASQGIEDTQTGIDKAIEDKLGTGDASKTAKFLANTGLSIGRVAAAAPFGQTGALTLMSGAQAGQSAYDILQRGGDTKQAAAIGAVNGLIEAATEKIPLDNLFKIAGATGKQGILSVLKTIATQAGIEGTEEMISQIAQTVVDVAGMGDKSEFSQYTKQLESQGMSKDEAQKQAFVQYFGVNVGMAGLGGAVSGGILGGGASIIGNARARADTQLDTQPYKQKQPRR
jgi:hypothetical protein